MMSFWILPLLVSFPKISIRIDEDAKRLIVHNLGIGRSCILFFLETSNSSSQSCFMYLNYFTAELPPQPLLEMLARELHHRLVISFSS